MVANIRSRLNMYKNFENGEYKRNHLQAAIETAVTHKGCFVNEIISLNFFLDRAITH